MRTNLVLFILLCILLGVAYYTEEIYKKSEVEKQTVAKTLLRQMKLTRLEIGTESLVLQDNIWSHQRIKWPLDQGKVGTFFKILHSLQLKQKLLVQDSEQFFKDHKLDFSVVNDQGEKFEFSLGDAIPATGHFYILNKQEQTVYICEDSSSLDQPFASERDYNLKKYMRLSFLLKHSRDSFWESNFLKALKAQQPNELFLDTNYNRDLKVDFLKQQTTPAILKPLIYTDARKVLEASLNQIRVVELIDRGQNILSDKMAHIDFYGDKNITLKYFIGLNNKPGKFITVEGLDYIFRVEMPRKNLFFLTAQDFWMKKFHFKEDFKGLSHFDFQLSYDGKKFTEFQVYDLVNFKIKAKTAAEFSQVHMNVLFNMILNLVDFNQASIVESHTTALPKNLSVLHFKLLGSYFCIWMDEKTISVKDMQNNLLYLFSERASQISAKFFSSVFTVRSN
jgi:hypothetical protein